MSTVDTHQNTHVDQVANLHTWDRVEVPDVKFSNLHFFVTALRREFWAATRVDSTRPVLPVLQTRTEAPTDREEDLWNL